MIALLMLLGIGLVASTFVGGSDDDGDDSGARTFGDEDDAIVDREFRDEIIAGLDDLVGEGEITQTEADTPLAAAVFTEGPQDVATGSGDDLVIGSPAGARINTGPGDDDVAAAFLGP